MKTKDEERPYKRRNGEDLHKRESGSKWVLMDGTATKIPCQRMKNRPAEWFQSGGFGITIAFAV